MALYNIADLCVQMDASGRTARQAAPYETRQGPADMVLRYDVEAALKNNPQLQSRDVAEYMLSGAVFARKLLQFEGFQLHASSVILNDRAYLFSAPSGTGKSTHTEKWVRLFDAQYLNDDKPVLRYKGGRWMTYGTPWSGKHDLSRPDKAPLGAVAFLRRGTENHICRLSPQEAIPYYVSQLLRSIPSSLMEQQLELLSRLLQDVPVYLLTCRNDDEAAFTARAAMEVLNGNN